GRRQWASPGERGPSPPSPGTPSPAKPWPSTSPSPDLVASVPERRRHLVLLDAGGHTALERLFLRLVRESGLPIPVPQVVHRHDGRHVARVDFLFADHDLVVEVSGGRGHSSPSERAKDARRRNELQRLGRTVLEFTYEQVTRRPDQVIATLTEFLGRVTVLRAPAAEG